MIMNKKLETFIIDDNSILSYELANFASEWKYHDKRKIKEFK